jgi:ergothioneine biosynthesis glutamate--cysteine ligase EgtA
VSAVVLSEEQAVAHIHGICLKTGPPRRVGVELEWLVRDVHDPALPVSPQRIAAAVAGFRAKGTGTTHTPALPFSAAPAVLPSGAPLTTEPGGQLEVSSLPADTLADCVTATAADLAALRSAVATADLELAGIGLDPYRTPRRVLRLPRYAAMEAFFDRDGPWGRQMMCATASVQICLDAGDDSGSFSGYRYRWRLLHSIGPVLVAAFANSPLRHGRLTGWRSSRQQTWARMDTARTRPPAMNGDPVAAWAAYALDAQVMCVLSEGDDWTAPPDLTFRGWVRDGGRPGDGASDGAARIGRAPTKADLDYHLSTLFPPVRPRGHLEIRMIDAQPGDGWVVPLAVTSALLADGQAADLAMAAAGRVWNNRPPGEWPPDTGSAAEDAENPWIRAARCGPADPAIARASRESFAAAREALARQRAPRAIRAAVDAFIDTYVTRNRCPADDLIEEDA